MRGEEGDIAKVVEKEGGAVNSHSLNLHAEQLQQRREDAHVVKQEDVAAGPAEDVGLSVTLVKHPCETFFCSLSF